MDKSVLAERLQRGEDVYILADYNGLAVHYFSAGEYIRCKAKWRQDGKEFVADQGDEMIFDALCGGREITATEYSKL